MNNSLTKLQFSIDGDGLTRPSWASFYQKLGARLAQEERAVFMAILTPTRRLASVLLAAGFVVNRICRSEEDPKAHFESLKQMGSGTPVSVLGTLHSDLKNDRRYDGRLCRSAGDLAVKTNKGTKYLILSASQSLALEPRSDVEVDLPEYSPRGYKVKSENELVRRLLPSASERCILLRSAVECSIVGTKSTLEEELEETEVMVKDGDEVEKGNLASIIKPREFVDRRENYWSDVFTFYGKSAPEIPSETSAILYDGVTAFTKWHDLESQMDAHRIAILRRKHGRFDRAVDLVRDKAFRRDGSFSVEGSEQIPPGVEVVAFR